MRDVTVVGASLAGLATARALRAQGFTGTITVVGDEKHVPYDRPPLSKEFLAGISDEDAIALTEDDDAALDVVWRLGRTALALDGPTRTVTLDDGSTLSADAVVLATGARARNLPGELPGGVHTLRTLDDARALRADLVPGRRLVVIGAGFVLAGHVVDDGIRDHLDTTGYHGRDQKPVDPGVRPVLGRARQDRRALLPRLRFVGDADRNAANLGLMGDIRRGDLDHAR